MAVHAPVLVLWRLATFRKCSNVAPARLAAPRAIQLDVNSTIPDAHSRLDCTARHGLGPSVRPLFKSSIGLVPEATGGGTGGAGGGSLCRIT